MRFETTLLPIGNNTGIEVPPEIVERARRRQAAGGERERERLRVPQHVAAMGGRYPDRVQLRQARRDRAQGGDPITVELTLDTAPRTVDVPADLAAALAAPGCGAAFDALAPSRQKAHVTNVEGAKAAETRARRVAAVVEPSCRSAWSAATGALG